MQLLALLKRMIWLVAGVLIASLSIFFVSQFFMRQGFESTFQKELLSMHDVVNDMLETTKTRLSQESNLLADSKEVQEAIIAGDSDRLVTVTRRAMQRCKASFSTIVDKKGFVLARGHSEERGDSLADKVIILAALTGKSLTDVVNIDGHGLCIASAAPVYVNNEVVGALFFGESFQKNFFVDEVKRVTGLDVSIFDGDKRIATTLMHDNERALGTLLNNDEVLYSVLQNGKTSVGQETLFGKTYKTVHWPLRNQSGWIFGMIFLGMEVDGIEKTIVQVALYCLGATILIALALSVLGIMFFRSLVNPLERKAYLDVLTGINNRAGFERKFSNQLMKDNHAGALFLFDLDNFKSLNDTLGHPKGDECLQRTASILKELFRETDIIARLGGDEFIVYAPTMQMVDVIKKKAESFLDRIHIDYPVPGGNKAVSISASIGIAIYPHYFVTYEQLYSVADKALYQAKSMGKNTCVIHDCRNEGADNVPILETKTITK